MNKNYISVTKKLKPKISCNWPQNFLMFFGLLFSIFSYAQTVTIGSGTNANYSIPVNTNWNSTYSQQIFTQSEINYEGNITHLRFYMTGGININNSNSWRIFLGHTTKTDFTSNTDIVSVENLTEVFEGTISASPSAGWYNIILLEPFEYNNIDNLIVAVQENSTSLTRNGTGTYARTFPTTGINSAIAAYSDSALITPENATTAGARTRYTYKNQLQIGFASDVAPLCNTDILPIDNASDIDRNPTLTWNNLTGATAFDIYLGTTSPPTFVETIQNTEFTPNYGLLPNTTYYWKAVPKNDVGITTNCEEYSFTTSDLLNYCNSSPTSNDGAGISNLTIGTNSTTIGDVFYVNITEEPIEVYAGITTTASITFVTGPTYHANIWVDLDYNGVFDSSELLFSGESLNINNTILQTNFAIPAGHEGLYRFRIGTADSGQAIPNPCYSGAYGITIDGTLNVLSTPSCLPPTISAVNNITDSSALITLNDDENYTNVEIAIGLSEDVEPETVSISNATIVNNTIELSDLNPNTGYKVWLRNHCNTETSPWSAVAIFNTLCELTTEFSETFDAEVIGINGSFPDCWSKNGSGSMYVNKLSSQETNHLYLYVSATQQNYIKLPAVSNLADGTNRLRIKVYNTSSTNKTLELGYFTNDNDITTFVSVGTASIAGTTPANIANYYFEPTDIPSNVYSLVLRNDGIVNGSTTFYIDEVHWEQLPTCLELTSFNISNIKPTSVQLNWSSGDSETQWEYVVGTTTDNPIDLSPISFDADETDENSFIATELEPTTTYRIWMRAVCGNNDVSVWTQGITFTTPTPGQVGLGNSTTTTFPLDSYYSYNYSQQIVTADELHAVLEPNSNYITKIRYKQTSVGSTYDKYSKWKIFLGNTTKESFASTSDYVAFDTLTQVYSNVNEGLSETGWIEFNLSLPFIWDQSSNLVVAIHEDALGYTTSLNKANFASYNAGSNKGIILITESLINLNSPAAGTRIGNVSQIQFETTELPDCLPAHGVTSSQITHETAILSWESDGSIHEVEYSSELFEVGEGIIVTDLTSDSVELTSLDEQTVYYFYIRKSCGNEFSDWTGPYSFKTACAPVLDFEENFDSITNVGTMSPMPNCWSKLGNGTVYVSSGSIAPNSPANRIQMYASSSADAYAVMPVFSNVNEETHRLSFKAFTTSANKNIEIGYFEDISDLTTFQVIETFTLPATAATSTTFYAYPTSEIPSLSPLVFRNSGSLNSGTTIYIDDIVWEVNPSCFEVSHITITDIQTTSASVNWESVGSETAWQYVITDDNTITNPEELEIFDINSGSPFTIENLLPNKSYKIWLRADCETSQSLWSSAVTFRTACAIVDHFAENFDTTSTSTMPFCWQKLGNGTTNTTSGSTNTASVPNRLYMSTNATTTSIALMPEVNNLSEGSHRLKFKFYATVANKILEVGYLTDIEDITSFVPLASFNNEARITQSNIIATEFDSSLYEIPTGIERLAFRNNGTINNSASIYIDDVIWEVIPSCLELQSVTLESITSESATLSWIPRGNESAWEYSISEATNNDPENGLLVNVIGQTPGVTIEDLTLGESYNVWVRAVCSEDEASSWSPKLSILINYCRPTNSSSEHTNLFSTTGATNDISYSTTSAPENKYTSLEDILSIEHGQTITINHGYSSGNHQFVIWIDFDNNLIYDQIQNSEDNPNGELIVSQHSSVTSSNSSTPQHVTINVPSYLPVGNYNARLRSRWTNTPTPSLNSCDTVSYGSIIDFTIEVTESLGNEDFYRNSIKLFPNPAQSVITITNETIISKVEIFDILGQKVIEKSFNNTQAIINVENLSNGTYLVKTTSENGVQTSKILKN